jgi:hypothetical protein
MNDSVKLILLVLQVWWSPCPSRECPEEEELDMVLADCMDHCLMAENSALKTESNKHAIISPTAITPPQVDSMSTITVGNLSCFMKQNTPLVTKKKNLHFLLEKVEKKQKKRR